MTCSARAHERSLYVQIDFKTRHYGGGGLDAGDRSPAETGCGTEPQHAAEHDRRRHRSTDPLWQLPEFTTTGEYDRRLHPKRRNDLRQWSDRDAEWPDVLSEFERSVLLGPVPLLYSESKPQVIT